MKNRGPPYGSKEEQKAKREKKEKADTTVENREMEVDDPQKIVHDDNEQNHERQFRDENMFKVKTLNRGRRRRYGCSASSICNSKGKRNFVLWSASSGAWDGGDKVRSDKK